MRAFIHTVGGNPFNEECASARRGFEQLGIEVVPFSNNDVLDLATRNDVVVGGMLVCQHALNLQGVAIPSIDYPYNIREFLGRRIDSMPVAAIEPADLPVFVKPVEEKDLPGAVVRTYDELAPYLGKGDDYELLVSEPVNFISEWRVFVRYRQVLGATHYLGDRAVEPDWVIAQRAISHFYSDRPNGYGLDLGVTDDGRTLIVEVNDGFALGSYGLDDVSYALLLSARWAQLMSVEDELHSVAAPRVQGPIADAMKSQRWHDYLYGVPGHSVPPHEEDLPKWVWGIAANIREYRSDLEPDQTDGLRKGTEHFAPGAHVWVMEPRWLWNYRITVVGKKKGTHRYIRRVMDFRHLESFRAKRIYSPTIISWMRGERSWILNYSDCGKYVPHGGLFGYTWLNRKEAEELAEYLNKVDADSD